MRFNHHTGFIGRDEDIDALCTLIQLDHCRLLTILGPGGIGKTRLAIEAARQLKGQFAEGVFFVDVQSVQDSSGLIRALVDALGLPTSGHDDAAIRLDLLAALRDKQILLVLDNVEQVLDGATLLADLLAAAAQLHLLVTSREALRLREEYRFSLRGLSVPADDDPRALQASSAIQLFLTRARQMQHSIDPPLPTVAAICRFVEGSPLAIELAAAWTQSLSVDVIYDEIRQCFDFLTTDLRNIPDRHRSIRAVFDSSWKLLNEYEQNVLMHLAVFERGFRRDAAEQVAGASLPTLTSLLNKSLLTINDDGRYDMHALIRQFAHDCLKDNDDSYTRIRDRHSAFFADFTQQQSSRLCSAEQLPALAHMQTESQNIALGWQWAIAQVDIDAITAYSFGMALFYQMKSRTHEGLQLLTVSAPIRRQLPPAVCAQIDLLRGWMLIISLKNREGVEAIWQALQHLDYTPMWFGMALIPSINQPELLGNRYAVLQRRTRAALADATDTWQQAWLHKAIGEFDFIAGRYDDAVAAFEESAVRFREVGDTWGMSWAYGNLGQALVQLQHYARADDIYQRSLHICETIGDLCGYVDVMNKQAHLALHRSRLNQAESILHESVTLALDNQLPAGSLTYLLHTYSAICTAQGRTEDAMTHLTTLAHNATVQRGWRQPEIDALRSELDALRESVSAGVCQRVVQNAASMDLYAVLRDIRATDEESTSVPSATLIEPLTDREEDVLKLIAAGLSNQEIADELVIAIGTVKTHAHNLYGKLAVTNRTEAAARAHDLDLV